MQYIIHFLIQKSEYHEGQQSIYQMNSQIVWTAKTALFLLIQPLLALFALQGSHCKSNLQFPDFPMTTSINNCTIHHLDSEPNSHLHFQVHMLSVHNRLTTKTQARQVNTRYRPRRKHENKYRITTCYNYIH